MRLTIKRLLRSKKTAILLMSLLLLSLLLSCLVPQRFNTPAAEFSRWREAHRLWRPVIDFLGLHRLFTAPWFAALLFAFLACLVTATHTQFRLALKKTLGMTDTGGQERRSTPPVELAVSGPQLARQMRLAGYLRIGGRPEAVRFVKHPWGHWGVFLLHLGMLVAIAASLFIALTGKRGTFRLAEGEIFTPGSPWANEELGMLASPFLLPEAVRLRKVRPEFWPGGGVKNIRSDVTFIAPDGETVKQTIAMTPIMRRRGLRIYQEAAFGTVFYLVFTRGERVRAALALNLESPQEPRKASYGTFDFAGFPYRIKAKYYADAGKKTLAGDDPLLVIRLVDGPTVIGELSLKNGRGDRLGPYEVHLVRVAKWAGFIFLDTPGMAGVFGGFFIFALGGVLSYFTIPREFSCQATAGGWRLAWRVSKFRRLYRDEYQTVIKQLRKQEET